MPPLGPSEKYASNEFDPDLLRRSRQAELSVAYKTAGLIVNVAERDYARPDDILRDIFSHKFDRSAYRTHAVYYQVNGMPERDRMMAWIEGSGKQGQGQTLFTQHVLLLEKGHADRAQPEARVTTQIPPGDYLFELHADDQAYLHPEERLQMLTDIESVIDLLTVTAPPRHTAK